MNILMIDELPLYISGMRVELEKLIPECHVAAAHSCDDAMNLLRDASYNLILLDGDMDCMQFLPALHQVHPKIPVVVMFRKTAGKMFSDYLKQNIKGVVTKDQPVEKIGLVLKMALAGVICFPEQVVLVDDKVANDASVTLLSHRQQEVLELLARGGTNKQIGRQLNISAGTVKVHLESIFNRLQVNNRTQAARLYFNYVTNHESFK